MQKDNTAYDYDAIVVGSGPNGLAAAITLQREGLSVLLLEGKETIGGGMRTAALTLPGFQHDICSAIHPMAFGSPFMKGLPLGHFGLEFVNPSVLMAHPLDGGRVAVLRESLEATAKGLGEDAEIYRKYFEPLVANWPKVVDDFMGPLGNPSSPFAFASVGLKIVPSADYIARRFKTEEAKGLWAGMAAHSLLPLSKLTTAAVAAILTINGHLRGWPIPIGGSQAIANAMAAYFISMGGKIETNFYVKSLDQLPSSRAVLFDVTPRQLLEIAGHKFSSLYRWQLNRYRYGVGVFKVDWAIEGAVPFEASAAREAGTVHVGGTIKEITHSEKVIWKGQHAEKPFVLLAQQSVYDPSRAPQGKHAVWGYCHVPQGSTVDMTEAIEKQVERFAPGFRERILARHTMNTVELEHYNPNYIGGDINGGVLDIGQLFTRPALRRSSYRTSAKGLYICSSSTPPGGGVHGMCGYHAANSALGDVFGIKASKG